MDLLVVFNTHFESFLKVFVTDKTIFHPQTERQKQTSTFITYCLLILSKHYIYEFETIFIRH